MRNVLGAVLLSLNLPVLASCIPFEGDCEDPEIKEACDLLDAGTDADAGDEDAPSDGGDPGDADTDPDANADGG